MNMLTKVVLRSGCTSTDGRTDQAESARRSRAPRGCVNASPVPFGRPIQLTAVCKAARSCSRVNGLRRAVHVNARC